MRQRTVLVCRGTGCVSGGGDAVYEALKLEDKVGTMLPCNVVIQELAPGRVEVAAIDPVASMAAIENPALLEKAAIVRGKLEAVIESL